MPSFSMIDIHMSLVVEFDIRGSVDGLALEILEHVHLIGIVADAFFYRELAPVDLEAGCTQEPVHVSVDVLLLVTDDPLASFLLDQEYTPCEHETVGMTDDELVLRYRELLVVQVSINLDATGHVAHAVLVRSYHI